MSTTMKCGPEKKGYRLYGTKRCSKKCPFWDKCISENKSKEVNYPDELIKIILNGDVGKNART